MECSRSDYSNLAADINLNEVTMRVGRWTQRSHPGTPDSPSLSSISFLSISRTHRQASEWVTSATPHVAGTNGGITTPAIAFLV